MKISQNTRLKTDEIIMLFGAMLLSIKMLTENSVKISLQYTLVVIFASIGISDVVRSMRIKLYEGYDRREFQRYVGLSIIYLAGAAAVAFLDSFTAIRAVYVIYGVSLIYSRVISIIKKVRPLNLVLNTILLCGSVLLVLAAFIDETETVMMGLMLVILGITIQTFIRLIGISMSQIRFDILKRIFIRSMATEVLLGLLILIVSFSFVLTMFEPGIQSVGDAMWYCFAIVTTIGFGDFTAVSVVGRVLSVVLGIYGIIVVALITSIVINFYSETKDVKMNDSTDSDKPGSPPGDEASAAEQEIAVENTEKSSAPEH